MFGFTKQEIDFIYRLKESGLLDALFNSGFGDVLKQVERARAAQKNVRFVSVYESLSEEARKGFDIATGRTRIEIKMPSMPKVKVMFVPEQIERLERLAERIEILHKQITGEDYAESKHENEYEN